MVNFANSDAVKEITVKVKADDLHRTRRGVQGKAQRRVDRPDQRGERHRLRHDPDRRRPRPVRRSFGRDAQLPPSPRAITGRRNTYSRSRRGAAELCLRGQLECRRYRNRCKRLRGSERNGGVRQQRYDEANNAEGQGRRGPGSERDLHGHPARKPPMPPSTRRRASATGVITNDDNAGPTNLALSQSSVSELAANGTVVGTLSTADPDNGDAFTYSLVGTDERFEVVGNQLKVKNGFKLDFEQVGLAPGHGPHRPTRPARASTRSSASACST